MVQPAVCFYWDPGPPEVFAFRLTFANDMEVDATPPNDWWTILKAAVAINVTAQEWETEHILVLIVDDVIDPANPPWPTVEFPIFHRDLRYEFGTVYNEFGPLEAQPCP